MDFESWDAESWDAELWYAGASNFLEQCRCGEPLVSSEDRSETEPYKVDGMCSREARSSLSPIPRATAFPAEKEDILHCDLCGHAFTGEYRRSNLSGHLHKRNRQHHWEHRLQSSACAFGGIVSALGASEPVRDFCPIWTNHDYIPGPGLDMACLVGFVCSTSLFYFLQNGDKRDEHMGKVHQDAWLICGIVCGTIGGLLAGFELRDSLFQILPWTILASLWLNSTL